MRRKTPTWENTAPGVRTLRLYKSDLNPNWPRVLVLELTAQKFKEFESDPLAFDKKYGICHPESPISAISVCAKPPNVKEIAPKMDTSKWTVTLLKHSGCGAACAGCPQESS